MSRSKGTDRSAPFVAGLLQWFERNARDLPWRHTLDPYAIWTSEIMLQQTQVKTVIPYWVRWMEKLPAIETLAAASFATIHKLWEGLGYYTRVRNMQRAAQLLVTRHGGKFPRTYDEILALPGIGPYTASAICSIALNQPTAAVDGNVIRVLARWFGIRDNARLPESRARFWQTAQQLIERASQQGSQSRSRRHCADFTQALMELGALVCTPRQPRCAVCPIKRGCRARRDGVVGELPNLGPRTPVTQQRSIALVIENRGRLLVRQRPPGAVNAHLWEFPRLESRTGAHGLETLATEQLLMTVANVEPLCTFKHSITRYRIQVEAFRATFKAWQKSFAVGRWLSLRRVNFLAFTSADRKILQAFQKQNSASADIVRLKTMPSSAAALRAAKKSSHLPTGDTMSESPGYRRSDRAESAFPSQTRP